jgi:hypothetical protein
LLRGVLSNGLLNPDYNRDIQTVLTPVYQPSDAYAGVLLTALTMIDAGTTGIVDISQASHTPEHSDAMVRGVRHPRRLFLSSRRRAGLSIPPGHQAAAADLLEPVHIRRLALSRALKQRPRGD